MGAPIYLDHHATTPCDARVLDAMLPWFRERFANASSRQHRLGRQAREATEVARRQLATFIQASPRDLTFTSGATEGLNMALKGLVHQEEGRGVNVILSAIEHAAVRDVCEALARRGVELRVAPVGPDGLLDPAEVEARLDDESAFVAVMAANNEIGTIQPVAEIGAICRTAGVPLVCDAAQALGRIPIAVDSFGADVLVFSAHKLYGPKGVGALWVRRTRPALRLRALLHGGGHERGLRAGTLPVPLIVGFGEASAIADELREEEVARLASLRDELLERLRDGRPDLRVNGCMTHRLANNLNVSFPGVQAEELLAQCPELALSSGSACSTDASRPSHVLEALGLSRAQAFSSLRFGLGRDTNAQEITDAASVLLNAAQRLTPQRP